jgi:predicted porin
MTNGLLSGSRWGIKGNEDLGSGLKANFVLEGALNVPGGTAPNDHALLAAYNQAQTGAGDSAANGQLFSRQATVGLSGGFGSVDLGFQASSTVDAAAMIDPTGLGGMSPVAYYSSWMGGASSDTRMANNAVKYKYNMANGSMVEAFYALGGNSGSSSQGRQVGLVGKFQVNPSLYLVGATHQMNDNVQYGSNPIGLTAVDQTGAAINPAKSTQILAYSPGLSATYYNSQTTVLGGSWQAASNLTLKAGTIRIVSSNASNPVGDLLISQNLGIPIVVANTPTFNTNPVRQINFIGGTYDLTAMDHIMAGYYSAALHGYTQTVSTTTTVKGDVNYRVLNLVYIRDLSKRTNVYVAYQTMSDTVQSNATSTPVIAAQYTGARDGQKQNSVAFGVRHSF